MRSIFRPLVQHEFSDQKIAHPAFAGHDLDPSQHLRPQPTHGLWIFDRGDIDGQVDVCADRVNRQDHRLADLAAELRQLHLADTDNIERIRRDYGRQVREYRSEALMQG